MIKKNLKKEKIITFKLSLLTFFAASQALERKDALKPPKQQMMFRYTNENPYFCLFKDRQRILEVHTHTAVQVCTFFFGLGRLPRSPWIPHT